mgnify:CR=1 FL=1
MKLKFMLDVLTVTAVIGLYGFIMAYAVVGMIFGD